MEAATTETAKKKPATSPASPTTMAHAPPIVMAIPLADIDESPSNPRKTFKGVEELAEDVKRRGIIEPVMVRPSPLGEAGIGRYELVFGARRFRASKLAGAFDIHAMVRHLSDADVLEMQIIENSKREDIHPLEEADGYRALHETHHWSVDDIAMKVGKSVNTVRSRLKLCAIAPEAREAVFADKITLGAALVFARIPHVDVQVKALRESLSRWKDGDEPVSAKDIAWEVRDKFMLRLAAAPFDIADAQLVAGAPACATCPKRTGNQVELFGDLVGETEDLCTDLKCFDAKKEQTWKNREAEAKAKGQKILSAKETKQIFQYGSVTTGEYLDLSATNYADPKMRTNKVLLGKADVPIVIARDESGGVRELVAKADFKKAAKLAGNTTATERSSTKNGTDFAAEQKAQRAKEAKKREAFEAELGQLVDAVESDVWAEGYWKVLAGGLVRIVWEETRKATCKRRGLAIDESSEKQLLKYADCLTTEQARGLVVELVVTHATTTASEGFKAFRAAYAIPTAKPKATAKKKKPAPKKKSARSKR